MFGFLEKEFFGICRLDSRLACLVAALLDSTTRERSGIGVRWLGRALADLLGFLV